MLSVPQGEAPMSVRRQKGARGKPKLSFYCGFHAKGKEGQGKLLGISWFV